MVPNMYNHFLSRFTTYTAFSFSPRATYGGGPTYRIPVSRFQLSLSLQPHWRALVVVDDPLLTKQGSEGSKKREGEGKQERLVDTPIVVPCIQVTPLGISSVKVDLL